MLCRCAMVLVVLASVLAAGVAHADVFNMGGTRDPVTGVWTGQASLEFVTVGDAGNAADTTVMDDGTTGYGSVPYVYQMGKYDVTVGQYVQFLNAVAKTDTFGLYASGMATDLPTISITRSGSLGSYSYSIAGSYSQGVNCPSFDVTWGDAARFCNWLQNGQPTTLGEVAGSTETGAYTLTGANDTSSLMAITRNVGATYFLPSEDEWYKAAYYKGGSANAGYWTYPTQSNAVPKNTLSGSNSVNYYITDSTDPTNKLTPVGAFSASPGPYSTFDMGGNVFQWNEATINGSCRGLRGEAWGEDFSSPFYVASSYRNLGGPMIEGDVIGFRVASVPEPSAIALLLTAAACLLACAWRKRRVRRFASALAALLLLSASVAHADVFNMPNGEAGGERGTGAVSRKRVNSAPVRLSPPDTPRSWIRALAAALLPTPPGPVKSTQHGYGSRTSVFSRRTMAGCPTTSSCVSGW